MCNCLDFQVLLLLFWMPYYILFYKYSLTTIYFYSSSLNMFEL